ncbi:MAG: hypothetical protein M3120_01115 [Pseudomonadota bacterium]|nr:hypothetical protein [Pseudomonadota bacterium]
MPTPNPSPPTDNLYKLGAVSGLLLILTTIILYVIGHLEVRKQWTLGITVLQTRVNLADARLKQAIGPPSNLIRSKAEQWNESTATKISVLLKSWLSRLQNTGTEVNNCKTSIHKALFLGPFLLAGGVIGVLPMNIGFYLWFSRMQKHQDKVAA